MEMGKNIGELTDTSAYNKFTHANYLFLEDYKEDDWRTVINLDIKPGNVVLGDRSSTYPGIPIPKMIDFGICYRPDDPEERNDLDTLQAVNGTPGYQPPVSTFAFNPSSTFHRLNF